MHARFHLPGGSYTVTLTLPAGDKVLDTRSGQLELVETDQEYGATWHSN